MSTLLKVAKKFQIKDAVTHITGGPTMVVEDDSNLVGQVAGIQIANPEKYNSVTCVWFDKLDVFHRMVFNVDFLEKV